MKVFVYFRSRLCKCCLYESFKDLIERIRTAGVEDNGRKRKLPVDSIEATTESTCAKRLKTSKMEEMGAETRITTDNPTGTTTTTSLSYLLRCAGNYSADKLLASGYQEAKASFLDSPYFTTWIKSPKECEEQII